METGSPQSAPGSIRLEATIPEPLATAGPPWGDHPPLVSVLLPVRDGVATLPRALDSIRGQQLRDLEVVAVDDGSSDGTFSLLRATAAVDPRIRVVRQAPGGIVAALETARQRARGRFLARMDADDEALPGRLEAQVAALESDPGLGVVGCGVRYFPRDRLTDGALRYESWLNSLTTPELLRRDLFVECPLAHPTFLLRREALEEVGGYREGVGPEDYDLLLRLWEGGWGLGTVPRVLLHWRDHPERLSRVDPAYAPEAFRRLKAEVLGRTLLKGREGAVIWGAGPTGKAFSRALREEGIPLLAFVEVDPRKLGQEIHGAPVIAPPEVGRFAGALCLAAVSGEQGREEVRRCLREAGWEEGRDFVAVA